MPTITIDNKPVKMTRLSRGSFARVYRSEDRVYHFVNVDRSCEREAISMFAYGKHIPQIEDHGDVYLPRVGWLTCYSMPYYNQLSKRNRVIAKHIRQIWAKYTLPYGVRGYERQDRMIKAVNAFITELRLMGYEELAENIQEIYDACRNYDGHFWLEFPDRNLKQDNDGNLILLDIVFNTLTL